MSSYAIKIKRPITNFLSNLLRDTPGCLVKAELFDEFKSNSDPVARRLISVGGRYDLNTLTIKVDLNLRVKTRCSGKLHIALDSIFGNSISVRDFSEVDKPIDVPRAEFNCGILEPGDDHWIQLTYIVYQTDEDKTCTCGCPTEHRYHVDTDIVFNYDKFPVIRKTNMIYMI